MILYFGLTICVCFSPNYANRRAVPQPSSAKNGFGRGQSYRHVGEHLGDWTLMKIIEADSS